MRAVRNICLAAACCSGASAVALTTGDDLALLQGSLQPEPRALGRQVTSDEFKLNRAAQQQQKEKQKAERKANYAAQREKEKAERKAAIAKVADGMKAAVRKSFKEAHDLASSSTKKWADDVNTEIYGGHASLLEVDSEKPEAAAFGASSGEANTNYKTEQEARRLKKEKEKAERKAAIADLMKGLKNMHDNVRDQVRKTMKEGHDTATKITTKVRNDVNKEIYGESSGLMDMQKKPFPGRAQRAADREARQLANARTFANSAKHMADDVTIKATKAQQEMRRLAAAKKGKADAKAIVSDMDKDVGKKWFEDIRKMAGDIVDDLRKAGTGIAKSMGIDKTNKAKASEGQEIQAELKQVAQNVHRSIAELGNFVALTEA